MMKAQRDIRKAAATPMVIAAGLALALAACGAPDTKGLEGEAAVTVKQALSGDRLVLSDGRTVALIGIEAPNRRQKLFDEARAALERIAVGRPAKLAHEGRASINDKTALGHLFVQTEGGRWVWVEEALLLEGLARVHTRKDGAERATPMLAAEAAARQAGRGLWADKDFAVSHATRSLATLSSLGEACKAARTCRRDERDSAPAATAAEPNTAPQNKANAAPAAQESPARAATVQRIADRVAPPQDACSAARAQCSEQGFQIVEGRVRKVFLGKNGAVHFDFGDNYKTDFSVYIGPTDVAAWSGGQDALRAFEGQNVRVRGLVDSFNGPSIRVDHAAQIEQLEAKAATP